MGEVICKGGYSGQREQCGQKHRDVSTRLVQGAKGKALQ